MLPRRSVSYLKVHNAEKGQAQAGPIHHKTVKLFAFVRISCVFRKAIWPNKKSSKSLLLSFSVHQRSPIGTKSITKTQRHSNLKKRIGEPPEAPVPPLRLSQLNPEVSSDNPSTIRCAGVTWPSRCVCLITQLLQHQDTAGMPMTLKG